MLLVYESRYYFIVCVEIDNALGTTIYFPSVIRDTGSDKFQPVHALLLSFHSPSSLSLSLCIYVPIFPYFLYSFEMTDRAWISTSYPFFGKKFSATEKGVHTLFFSLSFFPLPWKKDRCLRTKKSVSFLVPIGTKIHGRVKKNAPNTKLESFRALGGKFVRISPPPFYRRLCVSIFMC